MLCFLSADTIVSASRPSCPRCWLSLAGATEGTSRRQHGRGGEEHNYICSHKKVEFGIRLHLHQEPSSKRHRGPEDFNWLLVSASSELSLVANILQPVPKLATEGARLWFCTCMAQGRSPHLPYRPWECPVILPLIWTLTALVEEAPGLTGHTLKATVVETRNHSLVPFEAVAGAHRLWHLQEATGVLEPHGVAQVKGCSHGEWESPCICLHSSLPGHSPWLCILVAAGHLCAVCGASLAGLDRATLAWHPGPPPAPCELCRQ